VLATNPGEIVFGKNSVDCGFRSELFDSEE
jgi:hypothetical protein